MSKILIVDDEPTIVDLLEEHLQSEGYDTAHAFSGEEALRVLDSVTPDLVILDLMLPGMDGYEVCRLMQQNPRLNHIPVIMVTARSATSNRVIGYQRGADDYVVKPFDPEELSVRVRAQLHHLYHDTVAELTGMPGPKVIEEHLQRTTRDTTRPWAIIYVDITNFTAYNESYTFAEGDDMIKEAARALDQALKQEGKGNGNDFVGHMGGDKFVIITEASHVAAITERAQQIFSERRDNFYTSAEREQGFVATVNRQGMLAHVGLCELDFDVVNCEED